LAEEKKRKKKKERNFCSKTEYLQPLLRVGGGIKRCEQKINIGLVALYGIQPRNGMGQFLEPQVCVEH